MTYAKYTQVSVEKSKAEIEHVLYNYGADKFFYGTDSKGAAIGFEYKQRMVRLNIPNPDKDRFWTQKKMEAEKRRMWRVLVISLKSELEMIDAGLRSFEDIFLSQTVLPSGQTVSQWLQPQIGNLIEKKQMPKMLIAGENE